MVSERDWQMEEQKLADIRDRIGRNIASLRETLKGRKAHVVGLRRHFWDDITVNVDNMYEILETVASIRQQSLLLRTEEQSLDHTERLLAKLEKMYDSPYFGRIDFREQQSGTVETVYIGIGSLIDEETGEPYIYDWRVPIASLFYDYGPGPAQYESPDGIVRGEIVLKRQYVIEGGRLVSMFDTGLHIGDEMLRKMLGRHADEKMKSIVSTIQKEQNRIIRDDAHRVLIVQGAAGSGKTSAALQRIAYLLYKYRRSITHEQVLLFTPNELFQDYVSNVLPELGEQNVLQSTFYDYVSYRIAQAGEVEHPYDYLERLMERTEADDPRWAVIPFKVSLEFMAMIDRYAEALGQGGMIFRPFTIGSRTLISAEQLGDWYYGEFGHRPPRARLEPVTERIVEALRAAQEDAEKRVYRKLMKEEKYIGTPQELKQMSKQLVKKRFVPLYRMAKQKSYIDWQAMYIRLLEDADWYRRCADGKLPDAWAKAGSAAAEVLRGGRVPYEDAVPLMYLRDLLLGATPFNRIRYVLVDEAQDYTPFQIAVLKRLFPRARMTFLGDLNQSVFSLSGLTDYGVIERIFDGESAAQIRLSKSYRSTKEITEFSAGILPPSDSIEAFSRSGETPRLFRSANVEEMDAKIAADTEAMLREGCATVAVICRTGRESREAYERLRRLGGEWTLISRETNRLVPGRMVIASYMAKGLEFDGVVVYQANRERYGADSERRLLYTICTRALHRLHLHFTGEPSPLLPAADSPDERPPVAAGTEREYGEANRLS